MTSTATAAYHAPPRAARRDPEGERRHRQAMTIGTKTAETWSANRWAAALPFCASPTRAVRSARAACRSRRGRRGPRAGRHVTRAASHRVAGPTSAGTDSPVSSDASTANAVGDNAVGGDLLAGPDDELVAHGQRADRHPLLRAVAEHSDVLAPSPARAVSAAPDRCLGLRLQVAAGQDGRGDAAPPRPGRSSLPSAGRRPAERHPIQGRPLRRTTRTATSPAKRHAQADQRVHRRAAVAQARPRGAVERPGAPEATGAASSRLTHCQPGNCAAGTMAITITAIVSGPRPPADAAAKRRIFLRGGFVRRSGRRAR